MSWQHDPRTTIGGSPAFVCPPPPKDSLSLDTILGVGFGVVTVRKDDTVVWWGDSERKRLRSIERLARHAPRKRWTVTFEAALSGAVFERQGPDTWVLVKTLEGFA